MIKEVPRAWAILMLKKMLLLNLTFLAFSIVLSGQQVVLVNGESIDYSSIDIEKESISLEMQGETKSLEKSSVLYIIPEKKGSYTFLEKNNRKINLNKKDILNNYTETDIVRILAYKYYGTDQGAEELLHYNPSDNITKEDFILIFNDTQNSIRTRSIVGSTVGIVLGSLAFVIGLSSFLSSLRDLQELNNLSQVNPVEQEIEHELLVKRNIRACFYLDIPMESCT